MLFVEITPGKFEKFTQKHFSHYTQTRINYEAQYNAHLLSVKNDDGSILDLAAAIYIYNDYKLYYLSSSSNLTYNAYMGAYKLQ